MRAPCHVTALVAVLLGIATACGGASETAKHDQVGGGGVSVGGSSASNQTGGVEESSDGGTPSVAGGVSSRTNSQSVVGAGGETESGGISGTGGSTEEPWVVVDNGASCSPVAARGCSSENTVAQMVCSAGNVWQWSADCATGTVCDPRPGLKVGQCFTPDARCGGKFGVVCDETYGSLLTCESPGVVTGVEQCVSAACQDATSCRSWNPCEDWWLDERLSIDCSGQCGRAVDFQCLAPSGSGTNGLHNYNDCDTRRTVAVPSASALPTVASCSDVRVFWVWYNDNGCGEVLDLHLPPQYSLVVVSLAGAKTDLASVEGAACGLPIDYVGPTQFTPSKDEAGMIITRDSTAPGFRLVVD